MKIESRSERWQRAYEAAISPDYDVSHLQASCFSWASRDHIINHHSPILRKPQSFSQAGGDRLGGCFDLDPMNMPVLAQALVDKTQRHSRRCQPEDRRYFPG